CGCDTRWNAGTCLKFQGSRFCCEQNCSFAGVCGNALGDNMSLVVARNAHTGIRGVVASMFIPPGEVLGEYLGHLQVFGPPCRNGPINKSFRMHLKTRDTGKMHMGIDALKMGGFNEFFKSFVQPSARFDEMLTGSCLTVVAVSVREIFTGEEVPVSYGDCLWFVCRCNWEGCQHRDIQHLPDTARKRRPLCWRMRFHFSVMNERCLLLQYKFFVRFCIFDWI
ncbi:hypothetical protein PHMEG_00018828, partial [Phytophthora megakarya]